MAGASDIASTAAACLMLPQCTTGAYGVRGTAPGGRRPCLLCPPLPALVIVASAQKAAAPHWRSAEARLEPELSPSGPLSVSLAPHPRSSSSGGHRPGSHKHAYEFHLAGS